MLTVGIRELKGRLSAYVRTVRTGEVVVVTDHGDVVAELRPPPSVPTVGRGPSPFRDAVTAAWLRPPAAPADRSWLGDIGVRMPRGSAATLLDAERAEP